ncbi:MAG: sugar phosphate isomerase/epimerase family protein [Planctomycetota bacterium]
MYASLMTDLIDVRVSPEQAATLAHRHGFVGLDLRLNDDDAPQTAAQAEPIRRRMDELGLRAGYCSILPGKFSADADEWSRHRVRLEARCAVAQALGFTRTCAVVLPFHPTLAFDDAMDLHRTRLDDVLPVLAQHGIALGLEYVSPITRRADQPNEFIHDLAGMLDLIERAGRPEHLGLLLDTFHWHCAGESEHDLAALPASRVVGVHLNDAIADRPTERQRVDERELPGATGVIDLAGFMRGLRRAGYAGPISSEPSHPRWKTVDPDDACAQTGRAVRDAIALAAPGSGSDAA